MRGQVRMGMIGVGAAVAIGCSFDTTGASGGADSLASGGDTADVGTGTTGSTTSNDPPTDASSTAGPPSGVTGSPTSQGPTTAPPPTDEGSTTEDALTSTPTGTTTTTTTAETDSGTTEVDPPAQWSFARDLTFEAQGLDGPLQDFPVLVRLDDERIDYAQTQPDGADLRFIDSDTGATLAFEIERWDPAGDSIVWVLLPSVPADADVTVQMRYGNDRASDGQDGPGVWINDYVSVHHLDGDCGGGFADAADNGHTADCNGLQDTDVVDGLFGASVEFDGLGDLRVADHPDFDLSDGLTFQAMVFVTEETTATNAERRALGKGTQFRLLPERGGPDGGIRAMVWSNNGSARRATGDTISLGWHLLTGTASQEEVRIYLDGAVEDTSPAPGDLDLVDDVFIIGDTMEGGMDEIRISSVARTPDWIAVQGRVVRDEVLDFGPEYGL